MMSDAVAPIPRFYTIRNIAQALGVCTKTIRNWIDRRELRAYRAGRQIRISEADFQSFLDQRQK